MTTPDYSYDKKKLLDDVQASVDKHLKKKAERDEELFKKLDESNPVEQEMMFDMVKKNPPDPDFMRVTVEPDGDDGLVSKSSNGSIPVDPLFVFSPYIGFKADIAKAPLNVVPMLIDEAMNVVAEEKKAHKPEKRKDEFNWWWLVFILLILSCGASGVIVLMSMFGG